MGKASSLLTKWPGLSVGAGVDDVGWWGRLRRPSSPPHTNRANGNDGRRKRPHSTSTQPPPLQNGNSYARGRAGDASVPTILQPAAWLLAKAVEGQERRPQEFYPGQMYRWQERRPQGSPPG